MKYQTIIALFLGTIERSQAVSIRQMIVILENPAKEELGVPERVETIQKAKVEEKPAADAEDKKDEAKPVAADAEDKKDEAKPVAKEKPAAADKDPMAEAKPAVADALAPKTDQEEKSETKAAPSKDEKDQKTAEAKPVDPKAIAAAAKKEAESQLDLEMQESQKIDAIRQKTRDDTMKRYLKEIADDKEQRVALDKAKQQREKDCLSGKCAPEKEAAEDMVTVRTTDHTGMVSEKEIPRPKYDYESEIKMSDNVRKRAELSGAPKDKAPVVAKEGDKAAPIKEDKAPAKDAAQKKQLAPKKEASAVKEEKATAAPKKKAE